jgi:WD40 repeat protein
VIRIIETEDFINDIGFSHNGQVLATLTSNMTIILWRISDGSQIAILGGYDGGVNKIAFSPDGDLLASAHNDSDVRIWRLSDGAKALTLSGHTEVVTDVAFSPDGHLLASSSRDKTVKLWRVQDGILVQTLSHPDPVSHIAFSPDGNMLAASCSFLIYFWQVSDGKLIQSIDGNFQGIAYSPKGELFVAGGNDYISLLDVPEISLIEPPIDNPGLAETVIFSENGELLAVSGSGKHDVARINIWKIGERVLLQSIETESAWVRDIAFSPTGDLLASVDQDRNLTIWDLDTGDRIFEAIEDFGRTVAFSPDGILLATAGWDGSITLWGTR